MNIKSLKYKLRFNPEILLLLLLSGGLWKFMNNKIKRIFFFWRRFFSHRVEFTSSLRHIRREVF